MKNISRIFAVVSLLLIMVGCRPDQPELIEKIETAEALSDSQNISNYDLRVQRQRDIEDAQILTMSVRDGQITEVNQDCATPPGKPACVVKKIDPEEYTATGLFELARKTNYRASTLSFDDQTGVMTFLSLDDNSIVRVEFTSQE